MHCLSHEVSGNTRRRHFLTAEARGHSCRSSTSLTSLLPVAPQAQVSAPSRTAAAAQRKAVKSPSLGGAFSPAADPPSATAEVVALPAGLASAAAAARIAAGTSAARRPAVAVAKGEGVCPSEPVLRPPAGPGGDAAPCCWLARPAAVRAATASRTHDSETAAPASAPCRRRRRLLLLLHLFLFHEWSAADHQDHDDCCGPCPAP